MRACLLLRLAVLTCALCFISNSSAEELAKLYSSEGEVSVKRAGTTEWSSASKDTPFQAMDTVRTGVDSRAGILFANGVLLRLNSNARLQLKAKEAAEQPLLLETGAAHLFSRSPKQFPKIQTPIMTASVRGTEFAVEVNGKEATVSVLDGAVEVENKYGNIALKGGEQAYTLAGQAPVKRVLVNPLDAVQWTLHYPPFLELRSEAAISKAEESLKKAKPESKQSLTASILAQKAILALIYNKRSESDQLSTKALEADPNSITALLARSYIEQANFNLSEAKILLDKAAELSPNSSFIIAKQAELALSFGDTKSSIILANRALKLSPNDTYALTTLGFAELANLDTEAATSHFNQAIQADPAMGLPHLGLGLSKIKQGELDSGQIELQIAAHLEPNVSLYRSYLGKAFFEQEREDDADHELSRAIELDPRDPTPYLYRAHLNLSKHKPVEALTDIEQSIELNDNRAVYRSSLLLDEDSAVRSAGLSQAFSAVGFGALARNEALKSLNKDYSNYSAHLLLADSYDDSDLLATATLSELLVARLLSPASFNLVRPSSSSTISGNEFNALFDRPISRTQIEGTVETKRKLGDGRVIQSGISGKTSYAIDYEAIYADGFRDNDREKSHLLYLSTQHELTPETKLLLDGNLTTFDDGDTELGFDPNSNDADFSNELTDYFLRLGANHQLSPNSKIIAQAVYSNSTLDINDGGFQRFILPSIYQGEELIESFEAIVGTDQEINYDSEGIKFDAQYIYDGELVSIVAGGGMYDSNLDQSESGLITEDETEIFIDSTLSSEADNDEKSERAFAYTTWHLSSVVDLNLGASYSHLTLSGTPINAPFLEDSSTLSEWDPKIGITLYPSSDLTLRAAYFETVGSSGIREFEIIEPSFVGGFNQQYFDIFPGTRSENSAAGFDYKVSAGTYLGAESVWRELDRDFTSTYSTVDLDSDYAIIGSGVFPEESDGSSDEQIVRAYLYRVLSKQSTATVDYSYSQFDDDLYETEMDTSRVRAGLNYFLPSGFFLFSAATWREQKLTGYDGAEAVDGTQDFWIVDAGIGYQLPKRHGQIVLKINNILDQEFEYIPTGLESEILPGISGALAFNYNF